MIFFLITLNIITAKNCYRAVVFIRICKLLLKHYFIIIDSLGNIKEHQT